MNFGRNREYFEDDYEKPRPRERRFKTYHKEEPNNRKEPGNAEEEQNIKLHVQDENINMRNVAYDDRDDIATSSPIKPLQYKQPPITISTNVNMWGVIGIVILILFVVIPFFVMFNRITKLYKLLNEKSNNNK